MNRVLPRAMILAVVVAGATLALAWWVVPLIGLVFGFATARAGRPAGALVALKAGLLGWGALVVAAAVQGGAGVVATTMGGVLGLPAWAFYLVTPLYGGLLGLAGALLGGALGGRETTTSAHA